MHIRPARPSELGLVAGILGTAARLLTERGQTLWEPAEVNEMSIEADVLAGMYHLAIDEEGPVGVVRFQLEDRYFWPDIEAGTSAFVHKLAVLPKMRGRGCAQILLQHACELTRQKGRRFLRLDCVSGTPKLRGVYEGFGFRFHSEKVLDGRTYDRFEFELPPSKGEF